MMTSDAFDRDAEYDQIVRGTTLRQLRDLPDDELVRRYDFLMAEAMPFQLGPDGYLNELTRRETERQNQRFEWLTGALLFLTLVLLVATGVLARGVVTVEALSWVQEHRTQIAIGLIAV